MPLYTFKCDSCEKDGEKFVPMEQRDSEFPCECGNGTLRRQIDFPKSVWSPTRNGGHSA